MGALRGAIFARVMRSMVESPQHTYQVLTKRPERALEFFEDYTPRVMTQTPHLWLGTSVENQSTADKRIPLLLREWRNDYALFLRPHNEEGWDLVCYAVPRARLKAGAS